MLKWFAEGKSERCEVIDKEGRRAKAGCCCCCCDEVGNRKEAQQQQKARMSLRHGRKQPRKGRRVKKKKSYARGRCRRAFAQRGRP